jgi:coproporphyrinogen III oxidase-like Fe-S oxidoreductase
LDAYLHKPDSQSEEIEELPAEEKASEEAMLRLRLIEEGLDISELAEKYGDDKVTGVVSRLNKLVREGKIKRNGAVYRLEPSCALVSNSILAKVLGD